MFMFSKMRFEIIVFVLSAYCLSAVFARMPPWNPDRFCKSGVVGPACSSDYYSSKLPPCKPGYTCKRGFCCRDPVCPKGFIEGDSCNLLPGQKRCPDPYQCIDNFCCKERESVYCKSGVVGPACSSDYACKRGYTCTRGFCCRDPLCPEGWIQGGPCIFSPDQNKCPDQYQCFSTSNFCCKERISVVCPQFMPPRECPIYKSPHQCQTNANCRRGICCPGPCGRNFCIGNFPRPLDLDDTDS